KKINASVMKMKQAASIKYNGSSIDIPRIVFWITIAPQLFNVLRFSESFRVSLAFLSFILRYSKCQLSPATFSTQILDLD
ncbi:MAG: hypothetical protein ACTSPV_08485, partial [Candidatus Hodarchaeales archaeon]